MTNESLTKMLEKALEARKSDKSGDFPPWPPKWEPKPGETLEALIIELRETKYGVRRIVVDRQGNQITLPGSSAFFKEFSKTKSGNIGDFIYVKYEGEVKTKQAKPYKNFTIVVITKEIFDSTGDKFPAPKPLPKQETPQPQPQQQTPAPSQQPPTQSVPQGTETDADKLMKRLADMVGKVSGGLKREAFEKLLHQLVSKDLSLDEAALLYPSLIKVENDRVLKV